MLYSIKLIMKELPKNRDFRIKLQSEKKKLNRIYRKKRIKSFIKSKMMMLLQLMKEKLWLLRLT